MVNTEELVLEEPFPLDPRHTLELTRVSVLEEHIGQKSGDAVTVTMQGRWTPNPSADANFHVIGGGPDLVVAIVKALQQTGDVIRGACENLLSQRTGSSLELHHDYQGVPSYKLEVNWKDIQHDWADGSDSDFQPNVVRAALELITRYTRDILSLVDKS